jgi:hypothetical protein
MREKFSAVAGRGVVTLKEYKICERSSLQFRESELAIFSQKSVAPTH